MPVKGDRGVAWVARVDLPDPPSDPQDIAETAAVVLRQPGHGGKVYVLTGPEATPSSAGLHTISPTGSGGT
ncbi:hypothetical protein GCM10009789_85780 [Kribbella sancticallisti]|uniref:Uncharacterized protein n=1 Tax=Kribbella sancticallisti TaxID=460087 RepID=A0ABN2EWD0_9ACTN